MPVILGFVAFLALPARGDVVVLKNGARVEGEVVSESGGKVVVRVSAGTVSFRLVEVARIERGPIGDRSPAAPPVSVKEDPAPVESPAPASVKAASATPAAPAASVASSKRFRKVPAEKLPALVDDLVNKLADPGWASPSETSKALADLGPGAIPLIAKYLATADADRYAWLARALGEMGLPEAIPVLDRGLADEREPVRAAAVAALGEMDDAAVIPVYEKHFAAESAVRIRIQMVLALGRLKRRETILPLIGALGDPSRLVQEAARGALKGLTGQDMSADEKAWRAWWEKTGKEGNERDAFAGGTLAPPRNAETPESSDPDVAAEPVKDTPPVPKPVDRPPAGGEDTAKADEEKAKADAAILVEKLKAGGESPAATLKRIEEIGAPAVEALLPLVKSDDDALARTVIESLGRIKDDRAVDALGAVVSSVRSFRTDPEKEPEPPASMEKRLAAVKALGEIGDPRAVPYLFTRLENKRTARRKEGDYSAQVRASATMALSKLTGVGITSDQEAWAFWWNENRDRLIKEYEEKKKEREKDSVTDK
ncbi:MAG: HEAT repeat domain-containing protein [Planctomycetota bacterium]